MRNVVISIFSKTVIEKLINFFCLIINIERQSSEQSSRDLRVHSISASVLKTSYNYQKSSISLSRSGAGASGTFSTTPSLNLTSSITFANPNAGERTFGKFVIGIYQGTVISAANQIYPIKGVNVTLGRYEVIGGQMDYQTYNGTTDHWKAMIVDTNGTSNQAITLISKYLYYNYLTGSL